MKKLSRKEILILLFCLLIGFALRFYTFDKKSLWMDEIHTYNDSRDDLRNQLKFYKSNPTFLHPPLFFILTHQFYPFYKPERDLRIIPLIFGTLSIPMIFFLARSFSPAIALPCTLSLTFMAYHISLSQDGRSYAFLMFLGMASLYFFVRYLQTSKNRYLPPVAFLFALLLYTSYTSILFIVFCQMLWFYQPIEEAKKNSVSSFLTLNGLLLIFCLPWILFIAINYKGQVIMTPVHTEAPGSLWYIMDGLLHDWVNHAPLRIVVMLLVILSLIISNHRRNHLILTAVFVLPILGLHLFCNLFRITHFITSRYFINFLPLFFVMVYLSLDAVESKLGKLRRPLRMKLLFMIFIIFSNIMILPLYYHSEKQNVRSLVTYLKGHLRDGDKIFLDAEGDIPGILHYFGIPPESRHYIVFYQRDAEKIVQVDRSFLYQQKKFTMYHSKTCCAQYITDGNRLWIIATKLNAKEFLKKSPSVLKGYFDGSFLNFNRFPADASLYLLLWDPKSPNEKGIDMPIE